MSKRVLFISILVILAAMVISCKKPPSASFTAFPLSVSIGESVIFTNKSEDAVSYLWEFGDGITATQENPIHIYNSAGNFTVTLTAYSKKEKKEDKATAIIVVSQPLTITSPTSSSNWNSGTYYYIEWTDNLDTPGSLVLELYKSDTLFLFIYYPYSSNESYSWTVPYTCPTGNDYQIKITAFSDTTVFDFSNDFTITNNLNINVTTPTSTSSWNTGTTYYIEWTDNLSSSEYIQIDLYKADTFYVSIDPYEYSDGSYSWSVPYTLPTGTDYQIKISAESYPLIYDFSNDFSITNTNYITITSPSSSTVWYKSYSGSIYWNSGSYSGSVKIDLLKAGFCIFIISTGTSNDGYFSWSVPNSLTNGTDYQVKITHLTSSINDTSDNFQITTY
ncbi:MAG: PKD domain-containing protein [Bacteroidia bacterium]|nr:PKD domain-containing protein [Bacteroidia bacterium]